MEVSTWHWGTACQEPTTPEHQLPPDRLVFRDGPSGYGCWEAYKRGRRVDWNYYPSHHSLEHGPGLHMVHVLQWVKGYGPLYWKESEGEYYKVNLFLIEHNEEKLSQRIGMESFDFEPDAV